MYTFFMFRMYNETSLISPYSFFHPEIDTSSLTAVQSNTEANNVNPALYGKDLIAVGLANAGTPNTATCQVAIQDPNNGK